MITTPATRFPAKALLVLLLAWPTVAGTGGALAQQTEAPVSPRQESEEPPATPAGQAASPQIVEPPPIPARPQFVGGTSRTFEDIDGDLFYWGESATFTGRLGDNVFVGGAVVGVDPGAVVGGDLFIFAGNATIEGAVEGDVYAFTSAIRLGSEAVVHGNLMAMAGHLQVDGIVHGHVLGSGGGTRITGEAGGVDIEAGNIVVGDTARIRGDLEYRSNEEAEIADGAVIEGRVIRNREESDKDAEEEDEKGFGLGSILWTAWWYLSSLLVGVVLLLVGGRVARQPERSLAERPASGLGYGFVVAVVTPVACLVALVLIVSLPLGILGLLLFAVSLFLAHLVTAQFLGAWILERTTGRIRPSVYLSLALGLAVLLLLSWIPYLGFLIRLTAILLGLGGIFLAIRAIHRSTPVAPTGAAAPAAAPES